MANAGGEMWLQLFTCCYSRYNPPVQQRKRRIDRSMIGSPTNFQHTGHIGSTDIDMPSSLLNAVQNQMQSKGGYEMAYTVKAY